MCMGLIFVVWKWKKLILYEKLGAFLVQNSKKVLSVKFLDRFQSWKIEKKENAEIFS